MNSIRSQIFGGEQPERRSLIGSKRPRGAKADTLHSIAVTRSEKRTNNTRGADRHRLVDETVRLTHGNRTREAQLINLSGGGAMVSAEFKPMLWDRVDLHLGENGTSNAPCAGSGTAGSGSNSLMKRASTARHPSATTS